MIKTTVVSLLVGLVVTIYLLVAPKHHQLGSVARSIESRYTTIEHIDSDSLLQLDEQDLVFFDVREHQEFAVSHLSGAIHVAPDLAPEQFIEDFGGLIKGKHVVFYCSVGERSSLFLSKLDNAPQALGAISAANLKGGAFAWANNNKQLENLSGKRTEKVHPYNQIWGKLLTNQDKVSYSISSQ